MGCMDTYKDWRDTAPFIVVKEPECIPCQSIERANKVKQALFNNEGHIYTREEYELLIKSK